MDTIELSDLIDRLRRFMADRNTNPSAVSRKAQLGATAVHDIVSGKNRNPTVPHLRRIAGALDVTLAQILGEVNVGNPTQGTHPIPIIGVAEAGAFREMLQEVNEHDYELLNAPHSRKYPTAKHFAFLVRGNSMNLAPILEGTYVLCVDLVDAGLVPETDKVYVVRRTMDRGSTYEWTVKRAFVFKDRIELRPQSTDAIHKTFIIRPDRNPDNGTEIVAIGLVYATYAPFEQ